MSTSSSTPDNEPVRSPKVWPLWLDNVLALYFFVGALGFVAYGALTTPLRTPRLGPRKVQRRSIAAAPRARDENAALPPYQSPPCDHGTVYCDERVYSQAPWELHETLVPWRDMKDVGVVEMHARVFHPHDLIDLLVVIGTEDEVQVRWTFPDGSQERESVTTETNERTSLAFKRQPGAAGWAVGQYEVAVDIHNPRPTIMRFEVVADTP